MLVAEFEAVRLVGVAGDVESASVVHSMMFAADEQQVVGVGAAAVLPMDQVVHFEAERGVTARDPTRAVVAVFNDGAGAGGDDVLGAPNRHRQPVLEEHGGDGAVAGEVAADRVEARSSRRRRSYPARRCGVVGVDEQVDPEP